jgi:hypothetical protein
MAVSLPKDVIIEILSVLPMKDLIGAARVCKLWRDYAYWKTKRQHSKYYITETYKDEILTMSLFPNTKDKFAFKCKTLIYLEPRDKLKELYNMTNNWNFPKGSRHDLETIRVSFDLDGDLVVRSLVDPTYKSHMFYMFSGDYYWIFRFVCLLKKYMG